jgi:hypothetical protein
VVGPGATPIGPTGAGPNSMSYTVRVKNPESEDWFFMPERDWNRFGEHLAALSEFSSAAHDAFLVALGAGFGGVVAVVVWIGEWSQTKDPGTTFDIAGILLIVLTVAAFVVAFISNLQDKGLRGRLRRDADLLRDDMNHVHPFGTHDDLKPNA